jgi:hypothetical protein
MHRQYLGCHPGFGTGKGKSLVKIARAALKGLRQCNRAPSCNHRFSGISMNILPVLITGLDSLHKIIDNHPAGKPTGLFIITISSGVLLM